MLQTPACLLVRARRSGPASSRSLESRQDLLEHDPDLHPGQRRAQAEVGPVTEGDVGVGAPADVEAKRVLEHLLVEVGRRPPQGDLVALGDALRAELGRPGWRCGGCRAWGSSSAGSPRWPRA